MMRYTFVNDGLFGQLYESEGNMTELDIITYITIQLVAVNRNFKSRQKLSEFIGCSNKQLKVVLDRLKNLKGTCNSYCPKYGEEVMLNEKGRGVCKSLVTEEKEIVYETVSKRNRKLISFHPNYMPNYRYDEGLLKPLEFFIVTSDDMDLLKNGLLTRSEFVTYLFILKSYQYDKELNDQTFLSYTDIAMKTRRKLTQTTHSHIEKLTSLKIDGIPILKQFEADSHELSNRELEPISRFVPVFNLEKIKELKLIGG